MGGDSKILLLPSLDQLLHQLLLHQLLPGIEVITSPDMFLEVYSHTRHPLDPRKHLTILPSWANKAEKERNGECIICYGEDNHLQISCKRCQTIKVCCRCVVGIYQSIYFCPVCRFKDEFLAEEKKIRKKTQRPF